MFYEKQPIEKRNMYKQMLCEIGSLTGLFSESDSPYLAYRAHENIFCKYFDADNLGRKDCSADAKFNGVGIGLKTWMGSDDQKVAEFGKLRDSYKELRGIDLVKKIAEYRNERIRVTMTSYGLKSMVYHIVKRVPGKMEILEHDFDYIDIENIELINDRGNVNNTYFTDGKHIYHFSTSKNTLYMIFSDLQTLDYFDVEIKDDPYSYLLDVQSSRGAEVRIDKYRQAVKKNNKEQLCLRLYSYSSTRGKFVAEKSGLNQWNAGGRSRDINEVYIPYPKFDRQRSENFFPGRDTPFELTLPDGNVISAKVCQSEGKAIMSNPNKELGEWLLRKVFELPEKKVITYDMLEMFGIDSVVFVKESEGKYSLDFAGIGTYEELLLGEERSDDEQQ